MCVVIYKYERRGSDVLQTHSFRLWSLVLWAGSDMASRRVEGGANGGKATGINLFQLTNLPRFV